MSLCPHCRGENREDAERCVHCGEPLRSRGDTPPAVGAWTSGAPAAGAPEDPQSTDDPLAGLEGLLPPVILPPMSEIPYEDRLAPTEAEQQAAGLLYRIATAPPSLGPPRQRPAPAAPLAPAGRTRYLLTVLVLVAVLIPLVSRKRLDAALAPLPDDSAFSEALDALQPGDRVVLVFDHATSASAELSPLIQSALQQLAAQSVRIIALSTRAEGVDLARQALERLTLRRPDLTYGRDLVLLGYLGGDTAGVRLALTDLDAAFGGLDAAGRPLRDLATLRGLNGLNEADALLVIVDSPLVARRWIEQVGAWTSAPLLMAATAAAEPMLRPYAHSGQVAALLSGAYGGLARRAGATLYSADGFLAFALVLAIAVAAGVLTGRRRGIGGRP